MRLPNERILIEITAQAARKADACLTAEMLWDKLIFNS